MYSISKQLLPGKLFLATSPFIPKFPVAKMETSVQVDIDHLQRRYDRELADAKPFEEMPKLPSLPFIGSAWVYFPIIGRYNLERLHHADRHKYHVYGDVVREQFGKLNVVSSFRPEDMETVQRHEGKYPTRGEFSTLKAYRESRKQWYATTGLMVLEGKEWHDLRSKAQPHLLKPKSIHAYLNPMQDVAKDICSRILYVRDHNDEVPNLLQELYKWALESIAVIGLDTRLGCLENNLQPDSDALKMITSTNTAFELMGKLEPAFGNFPFWRYFETPTWRKFSKASDVFSEIAYKYINQSLEKLRKSPEEHDLTMLQAMLSTEGLDVPKTMVIAADMLMAGVGNTTHTASYLLYNLAKNPEKQEKLYQDLKRIFPSKSDKITTSTLNELRYLKSCLKESIRLDAVIRGNARIMERDVVISGYRVPAGTIVFIMHQVLSRLEKHFKNAEIFIPERWIDKADKTHPFVSLQFGFGPRSCIGRRIAELEIICLVTEIIKNFRLEYHYEDIDMKTNLVNTPDKPLLFKFIDR